MTEAEKLTDLKLMLDISVSTYDTVLPKYITNAGYFIMSVTNRATVPTILEGLQLEIAASKWSKRGAEGEAGHSEGGVSVTYESLSEDARSLLRSQALAKVVNMNAAPEA